jgi:hypothetical protein
MSFDGWIQRLPEWLQLQFATIMSATPSPSVSRQILLDLTNEIRLDEKDNIDDYVVVPLIHSDDITRSSLRSVANIKEWTDDAFVSYSVDHILGNRTLYTQFNRSYYDPDCKAAVISSIQLSLMLSRYNKGSVDSVSDLFRSIIGRFTPEIIIVIEHTSGCHWTGSIYTGQWKIRFDSAIEEEKKEKKKKGESKEEEEKKNPYLPLMLHLENKCIAPVLRHKHGFVELVQQLHHKQRDSVNCGLYLLDWLEWILPNLHIISEFTQHKFLLDDIDVSTCRHRRLQSIISYRPVFRDVRRYGLVLHPSMLPDVRTCITHIRSIRDGANDPSELASLAKEMDTLVRGEFKIRITDREPSLDTLSLSFLCNDGYNVDDKVVNHCVSLLSREYRFGFITADMVASIDSGGELAADSSRELASLLNGYKQNGISRIFMLFVPRASSSFDFELGSSLTEISSHWTVWCIEQSGCTFFDSLETQQPMHLAGFSVVKSIMHQMFNKEVKEGILAPILEYQDTKASCGSFVIEWVQHVSVSGTDYPFKCIDGTSARMNTLRLILKTDSKHESPKHIKITPPLSSSSSSSFSSPLSFSSSSSSFMSSGSYPPVTDKKIGEYIAIFAKQWIINHMITSLGNVTEGKDKANLAKLARSLSDGDFAFNVPSGSGSASGVLGFVVAYAPSEDNPHLVALNRYQTELFREI